MTEKASFIFSVDHLALTPLHFLSWSKKNTLRFLDQNSVIYTKTMEE
jgi:hypothetical protein